MISKTIIIAEVKTKSPFGYVAEKNWDELFTIAAKVGDFISIHTDPRWGGSFDLIKKAKSLTKKPILAKGIHVEDTEITEALAAGADFVLVVGRVPAASIIPLKKCLLEPTSFEQMKGWAKNPSLAGVKIVWNSRDLSTGERKKETFADVRAIFPGWLCQASNIRTLADIDPTANAMLVGTYLKDFTKSIENIQ